MAPQPVVPTPTGLAPASTTDAPAETGKLLVVGSSLENPPYSTYDDQFRPAGFDVALITEIGRRLNRPVEINDFTFEGLLSALQLEQVEVVIAAMDATPERAAQVDFTTPYFRGEDGILAAPTSSLSAVSSLSDLAGLRVGVQSSSVYEDWLLESLVQTGQMPRANLLSYVSPDPAVDDLSAGLVDVVVMDWRPAENFARQGKAKVIGHGLKPQAFAIALRKGSPLLPEFDAALAEMRTDGTLARLTEKYLGVPSSAVETGPLPTAEAVSTPAAAATPAACLNGMAWVAHLNLDDQNMVAPPVMQPGQAFTKSWRLRNAGTCDWSPDFTLTYRTGTTPAAQMGGSDLKIGKVVAPGETIDLSINLVAPSASGTYQGVWQMTDAAHTPFGERIWAGIRVP